jgi:hypothetical protein
MNFQIYFKAKYCVKLMLLLGGVITSCVMTDPIYTCLPIALTEGLQTETVEAVWQREISDTLLARVFLAQDQVGKLAPQALFIDSKNRHIAMALLEDFEGTSVYVVWINDEIQQTSSTKGNYTTVHLLGYIPPELYPNKTLFTADFIFRGTQQDMAPNNDILYRESAFQKRVIWFPVADFDFVSHPYLIKIAVDTEESLATEGADTSPGVYREWQRDFEPGIDISKHVLKISQLDWLNYTSDTECINLE